ncbi:hypothetical protein AB840_10125 [Megasphaera cerevisiae DSM 20462]|uniref:ATP-binding protein n=1 Tax=Megasphaera cerevisiae DSM 20462 TaxID=1122219 RepID=A0A0J6WU82_9FIRM|nr:ATP-binding protein [Megasphaera cerevisiae]KMO86084.1 hypothetical protein AB840_10125 [Megasphaera cerevisiae DSM 20462]SKA02190.1 AAA domain-containing protein [Megasphaera cerevisiae DSM 20462]
MKVISGKIEKAVKVVLYAPEGFGKSTFANHFPKPIFIDVEGGTNQINCDRTEKPETFGAVINDIKDATNSDYKTIVLDTIDWTEQLSLEQICKENQVSSIESFGYGKGYTFNKEQIGKLLNLLQDSIEKGKNVVILAHSTTRKQERPNDPPFDRYELKLNKQTTPLVKEWADILLFANYKYIIYEEKGTDKKKVSGGKRVMYTTHNPCWDAKNRCNLPDELPFEYQAIAAVIPGDPAYQGNLQSPVPEQKATKPAAADKPKQETATKPEPNTSKPNKPKSDPIPELQQKTIPPALRQLMEHDHVTQEDIMRAVYDKGYFPAGTPFKSLPDDFVNGCLIAGWNKGLIQAIQLLKENVPF